MRAYPLWLKEADIFLPVTTLYLPMYRMKTIYIIGSLLQHWTVLNKNIYSVGVFMEYSIFVGFITFLQEEYNDGKL